MMETNANKLRGHEIKPAGEEWVYCDTGKPTAETWRDRPCGHCGLYNTPQDHDGCLGTLSSVINACCGHGNSDEAYVQFEVDSILRGKDAIEWVGIQLYQKRQALEQPK